MTTDSRTPGIGLRSERGPILASLMLSTGLVALDATIIATAVLSITRSLGGFSQFPWLFSIYLLAQAVTVPVYGKLADIVGRKPVILFGIATFAVGSLLCGLATSMTALIVFRAVQGVGAGAIQPMTMVIAGDLYTLAERARVQGYLASVWAISAVGGPLLGGVLVDVVSWRWIFLVNLPLAGIALWTLARNFREETERGDQRIDYPGAVLLTIGAGAVILGLLEGGQAWAWSSPRSIAVFATGAMTLAVFGWVETRTDHPILPLWVFTRRVVIASSLIALSVGAVMLGLSSYVPTFGQGVLGASALVAGLTVGALSLGWPLAASQAGKVYLRIGIRGSALIGSGLATLGALSAVLIDQDSPVWRVALSCFVIGAGLGLVSTPSLIAAQTSAQWSERGVVTSANSFSRSIGSAVGVAVFGAIVNARIGGAGQPEPALLAEAVHLVFVAIAVLAALLMLTATMLPGRDADGTL